MRNISVLDAPSNLGLGPPGPGLVPGVYKLGWALRAKLIVPRLHAIDQGVVVPPRYRPETDGKAPRNQASIADYSRRLADHLVPLVRSGSWTLVLGGDCSILLGTMLALRRLGRYGLIFLDGHTDFRHPAKGVSLGGAAGEDLALATGRGGRELADLEGLQPLVREEDVVAIGSRADDEYRDEVRTSRIQLIDVEGLRSEGAKKVGRRVVREMTERGSAGYWIHLDVDVLDPEVMPAVDAPSPGGLSWEELGTLIRELAAPPGSAGLEVTVFDPDLDEDGKLAAQLVETLVSALS
ncbi:MAG: arginase family protein [Thermoplasmata archaeon]